MFKLLLPILWILFSSVAHPIHMTFADISKEPNGWFAELKVFTDDWEAEVGSAHSKVNFLALSQSKINATFYFIKGKKIHLPTIVSFVEKENKLIFRISFKTLSGMPNKLHFNTFFSTFDDQQNVAHFQYNGKDCTLHFAGEKQEKPLCN